MMSYDWLLPLHGADKDKIIKASTEKWNFNDHQH